MASSRVQLGPEILMAINFYSERTALTGDRASRRLFIAVQASKAAIGAALGVRFIAFVGKPDVAEVHRPCRSACAGHPGAARLHAHPAASAGIVGIALFAALIGYLAALTGGVLSPLVVWFALVPAEAALAGGRPAVLRAAAAAAVALIVVAAIEAVGALPPSRLPIPIWEIYAISVMAAVIQAALVAAAAQERQQAADLAAAEGAAMYRFLADNAMDLITRHSSDGRIRFAQSRRADDPGPGAGESRRRWRPSALVHPDDLRAMQAAFMEAAYFARAAAAEVRMRRRDGSMSGPRSAAAPPRPCTTRRPTSLRSRATFPSARRRNAR